MLIFNASLPAILNLFNTSISDLSSLISNGLISANNELIKLGNQLNIDLSFINDIYLENSYFTSLLNNVSYNLSFLVGSILALPVSYGLSRLIYGLWIKKLLYKKDIYCNKIWHRFTSLGLNFVYAFFLICFILSPFQASVKSLNYVYSTLDSASIKLDDFVGTNQNTINELESLSNEVDVFIDDNQTYIDSFYEYSDLFITYTSTLNTLSKEGDELISDLNNALPNLSSTDSNKAREVLYKLNAFSDQLNTITKEVEDGKVSFEEGVADYKDYFELLEQYQGEMKPALEEMKDSFTIASDIANQARNIKNQLSLIEKIPSSSWFAFLLDNVNFTGSTVINGNNFNEEIIIFSDHILTTLTDDIDAIQSSINSLVNEQLGDIESLKNDFDEGKKFFEENRSYFDNIINEAEDVKLNFDSFVNVFNETLEEGRALLV